MCKTFFFFHHLLIYFPVRLPISLLHKNHSSFEALKLVFWFSVGKDKIHVGYCWNKMYIWDFGILWFFFFFFGSSDHGWAYSICVAACLIYLYMELKSVHRIGFSLLEHQHGQLRTGNYSLKTVLNQYFTTELVLCFWEILKFWLLVKPPWNFSLMVAVLQEHY